MKRTVDVIASSFSVFCSVVRGSLPTHGAPQGPVSSPALGHAPVIGGLRPLGGGGHPAVVRGAHGGGAHPSPPGRGPAGARPPVQGVLLSPPPVGGGRTAHAPSVGLGALTVGNGFSLLVLIVVFLLFHRHARPFWNGPF